MGRMSTDATGVYAVTSGTTVCDFLPESFPKQRTKFPKEVGNLVEQAAEELLLLPDRRRAPRVLSEREILVRIFI